VPKNSGELYFPQLKQSLMPVDNQLIMFNGSTRHGVKENLNDEERICVSFNVKEDMGV
jgi:ectoine hydroxylase-related dioxygenase (phytanoyl-CoA dioxygenase family)